MDDHPEASRLLAKLLRSAGHEVAEAGDHDVALAALTRSDPPVDLVVASFTTSGTGASLRLLDAVRNHYERHVNEVRFLMISDHPRKQIFCFQAGADGILLRPIDAASLLQLAQDMVGRPEEHRVAYRRQQVRFLKQQPEGPYDPSELDAAVAAPA